MRAHLQRDSTNRDCERGSVSLWMVTAAMAMIILAGLAVDLGGQVLTRQHVNNVAAQAARAGGQQLQASRAIRGQGVRTDPALAAAAARSYLAASDVVGTVQLRGSTAVIVHTSATAHWDAGRAADHRHPHRPARHLGQSWRKPATGSAALAVRRGQRAEEP